jgi:hypothetical protein
LQQLSGWVLAAQQRSQTIRDRAWAEHTMKVRQVRAEERGSAAMHQILMKKVLFDFFLALFKFSIFFFFSVKKSLKRR